MLENFNLWLVIAATLIGIIASLFAGLSFIWKLAGSVKGTLINLNNSIEQLNINLDKLSGKTDKTEEKVDNHELRLVIIERELEIKGAKNEKIL